MAIKLADGPLSGMDVNAYELLKPEDQKAQVDFAHAEQKKLPRWYLDMFMPSGVTRQGQQSGYSMNPIDFLGNAEIKEAPAYLDPKSQIYEFFKKAGISAFDARHPLGMGGNLGGGGSGMDFDVNSLIKSILLGGGGSTDGSSYVPGVTGSLMDKAKAGGFLFADNYDPDAGPSGQYFKDYLASVSGPSTADDMQKAIEDDAVKQLLAQIDQDTEGSLASNRLDYLERGFGGPGQVSELETAGAAGIRAGGVKAKADARTKALLANVDRLKAKETAKGEALGKRYELTSAAEGAGAQSDAQILSSLLGKEFEGGITTGEGAKDRQQKYTALVLDAALKGQELSQQDRQFLQKLLFEEEQGALERDARTNIARENRPQEKDDALGWAGFGLDLLKFAI